MFDTLKAMKALRSAGFEERQAEAVVETVGAAISENVATKADLEPLATREELVGLRGDMEKMEASLRGDMERGFAELRRELSQLEHKMTLRLGAMIAAAVGLIVAAEQLL